MKSTQLTELLANIKATFVSFFSILMFVALGVGIFAGIYWTTPALENTAHNLFEEGNLHHFQIQFPYGLTENDITELKAIEGVDEVEIARQSYQVLVHNETRYTTRVQSLPEAIDTLELSDGSLAKTSGEIVLLAESAKTLGVSVGDTVTFEPDADNDGMTYLRNNKFRVTGIAQNAEYLSVATYTYGFAPIGGGTIDVIAWVPLAAFKTAAFYDGWPIVNIRAHTLKDLNTFSQDYESAEETINKRISQLGDSLADTRFTDLHTSAQEKIDEGEKQLNNAQDEITHNEQLLEEAQIKISEGEKLITEGQQQLAEGDTKIANGEQQLADARAQLAQAEAELANRRAEYESRRSDVQSQLDEAKRKLDEAQGRYDTAEDSLARVKKIGDELIARYKELKDQLDGLQAFFDGYWSLYLDTKNKFVNGEISADEFWKTIEPQYNQLRALYEAVDNRVDAVNQAIDNARKAFPDVEIIGAIPKTPNLPTLPDKITDKNIQDVIQRLDAIEEIVRNGINAILETPITIAGQTITVGTAEQLIDIIPTLIKRFEDELANQKKSLDDGRKQYEEKLAAFDKAMSDAQAALSQAEAEIAAARDRIAQGEQELAAARTQREEGQRQLEEKQAEIKEGKQQLKEKQAQLKDAKEQVKEKQTELEDSKVQLGLMKNYKWTVAPRAYTGGAVETNSYSGITYRLSFSMAALFVIVGLLVSYSAISRLVHEQIIQIGTKKALGFRGREITTSFLFYAALAVLLGSIIGLLAGIFFVERIISTTLIQRFTFDTIPPYWDIPLALIVTGIELVLVLGTTWLACRSILKRHAVELLRGEKPPSGKERFFEKWKVWDKLPLYTQTIVNNCLNDKRRVFSTIVGVAGCTALIVTAITLNNDILKSFDIHYDHVYNFDSMVHLTKENDEAANQMNTVAQKEQAHATPVQRRRYALQQPDGTLGTAQIIVPTNSQEFSQLYKINPKDGTQADLNKEGIYVAEAYASKMGASIGDEIIIEDTDGAEYRIPIVGFYEFYFSFYEMVMGQDAYERIFDKELLPNTLLVNTNQANTSALIAKLKAMEDFSKFEDDKEYQGRNYKAFASVSSTVVAVYLTLAILMAIVVLLNLNVMFIEEKKRELIVLMINGFSVKDAKRYVYNDTIVLTIIGIALGLIVGSIAGITSVASVEASTSNFWKAVDIPALGIGVVISAVLAFVMSAIALRRVPRFNLTDINRI